MSHARGGSVGEGNVVRKSSKRSRIILGAAVASALAGMTASSTSATVYTWKGTAGGPSFWDVNTNWSPNTAFPGGGDDATFGNGALDFVVNLNKTAINPTGQQSVFNINMTNTAGSYDITGGLLNMTGVLTKTGGATNTISAQVNSSAGWNINGGTLRITNNFQDTPSQYNGQTLAVAGGATLVASGGLVAANSVPTGLNNAINGSNVALANGATLRADGVLHNGLLERYYDTAVGTQTLNPIDSGGGLFTLTPSGSGVLYSQLRTSDQGQTGSDIRSVSGGVITEHDNFSVLWSGNITVPTGKGGLWAFGTNSDDGSAVYIDLNNDNVFDPSTELIVNNNFFQGPTQRGGVANLTAGQTYKIAIGWYEGGVTGEVTAAFQDPTTPGFDPNDPSKYTIIDPGQSAQGGMWSTGTPARYDADYSSTTVNVANSASSTVDVDAKSATFGELTMGTGSTLNVTGVGAAKFSKMSGTTGSTITLNTTADMSTGVINANFARINKTGPGQASADNTNSPSQLSSTSVISIQQGKFLAKGDTGSNTIRGGSGGATIQLDGGTFVAMSTSAGIGLQETFISGDGFATGPINPSGIFRLFLPKANMQSINTDPGPRDGWENNSTYAYTGKFFVPDNDVLGDGKGKVAFAEQFDDNVQIKIDGNVVLNNTNWDLATTTGPLTLTAGWHDIDMRVGQGGGGVGASGQQGWPSNFGLVYDPQGRGDLDPTHYIMPVDPGDGSLFRDSGTTAVSFADSNVIVNQNGTIDVFAPSATFGNLTINAGKTLTITDLGTATFAQTTVSGGDLSVVTDSTLNDMTTGRLINGGGLTGVTKAGAGALIMDFTGAASPLTAAMSIKVNGGTVVGSNDGVNNSLGAAPISLNGNNAGVFLASKAAAVTYANPINANGTSRVSVGNRGTGAVDNAAINLSTLNLADGANLSLTASNGYKINLPTTNLAGNATLNSNVVPIGLDAVTAAQSLTMTNIVGTATSNLTINGNNGPRITGNVTAANTTANTASLTFIPGGATKTVSGNLNTSSSMRVQGAGVLNIQGTLSGVAAVAGLTETFISMPNNNGAAGFWEGPLSQGNIDGVPQSIQRSPRRANQPSNNTTTSFNPSTGWKDNSTYAYTGQIYVPDNDVAGDGIGKVAFGMRFDDNIALRIDGQLVMRDTNWDNSTSSGQMTLSAGWHDIDMRFGEGGGGVGPNSTASGWSGTSNLAFGYQTDPTLGFDIASGFDGSTGQHAVESNYSAPVDDGSMNIFRVLNPTAGTANTFAGDVTVDPGAELKVNGITQFGGVTLNGTTGLSKLTLNDRGIVSANDMVNLKVPDSATGEASILGNLTTLSTNNVSVGLGSTLTKTGGGTLRATSTFVNAGSVTVSAGKLQVNGVGSGIGGTNGSVTVQNGAALGGSGSVPGPVTVNTGGALSPHDSPTTVATLTLNDVLNMDTGALLNYNFGTFGDSTNVLGNLTLNGNTSLNLHAIPGFTVGNYTLFSFGLFTNTGDVTFTGGSNDGPGAFIYEILEPGQVSGQDGFVGPDGKITLHVTAQVLKWTGASTPGNVWDINTTPNWQNNVPAPAKYLELSAVVFDNTGINRNITVTAPSVSPASITVNNDATHAYSIGGNPITGPTGILKQGLGTLTLTGSNTYIGPINVENGVLEVNALANAGSASALGSGPLPVALGTASTAGTLRYIGGAGSSTDRGLTLNAGGGIVDTAQNIGFNGVISGAGPITKIGAGTLSLGGLVNTNSGNVNVNGGTLSAASLGAGDVASVIAIANGSTFDWSGPTGSNSRGVNIGTGGGNVSVSNAASTLTLSGAVNGTTLGKTGTGSLNLSGLVNLTGASHSIAANSGVLNYSGSAGNAINGTYNVASGSTLRASANNALGTVAVALNGGTLSLRAQPTVTGGLDGEFYQFTPSTGILGDLATFNSVLADPTNSSTIYARANTRTSANDPRFEVQGAINHVAGGGNPFDQYTDGTNNVVAAPGGFDNLVTRWTGKLNVSAAQQGLIQFFTASDDGSKLWIDGVEVVNNNFFQGTTERGGSINLTEGVHDVVIGYYEGGGDASMIWSWTPVGGTKQVVPNSVLGGADAVAYGNNVSTAAGSTSAIDASGGSNSALGTLTLGSGSTLNISNLGTSGTGNVSFTGTTIGGTSTVNDGWTLDVGQISGTGTLNHGGPGLMLTTTANLPGMGAGSIVNMTGGTLGVVGDAGKTDPLGQGSVTLNNGTGMIVGAVTGDVPLNNSVTINGTARVSSGIVGSGTAGPHTMTIGSAAKPFSLAAGAVANLGANDGTSLVLPAVQLAGDGALNNSSSSDNVTIGNASLTGGTATFGGTKQMRLTGNITGSVTNVVVNNGALNVDPGAAGTSNVNGPMKVLTTLNANTGTLSLGANILSGDAPHFVAGLFEGRVFNDVGVNTDNNNYNKDTPNPKTSIQLGMRRANQPNVDTGGEPRSGFDVAGWQTDTTYIYTGQILVPDNDVAGDGIGKISFSEHFDDWMQMKIDGQVKMEDAGWNVPSSSGALSLSAGWHDVEFRFGQGVGGVGSAQGNGGVNWPDGKAFGIDFQARGSTDGSTVVIPTDDGTMNLFRTLTQISGTANVAAGSTINAGGIDALATLNLNGGASPANVNLNATSVHTGTLGQLNANGDPGAVDNLSLGANNTLQAHQLNVKSGVTFNKNGAGTLRVAAVPNVDNFTNTHDFATDSTVNVNGGKLIIDTSPLLDASNIAGTGSVHVFGTATLGGTGTIAGAVTVDANGHIAPGDGSVGTLTAAAMGVTNSIFDIKGGAAGLDKLKINSDGTANVFTLAGNSTIQLNDLGGVAAGDYVIIDYNNLNPIADALTHLHTAGSFAGLTSLLVNDTTNQDIVLRLTAPVGVTVQWNVDSNGSWGLNTNWDPQTVPDASTAIANMLGKITAARTVTLDGNRTVAQINFDNANTYTIASGSGGTLTVMNSITVTSGSHVISAPLAVGDNVAIGGAGTLTASGGLSIAAGKTATKSGAGTLTVSGAQGHGVGSTLKASGGVVNLNSNAGGGTAATSNLALNIGGGPARVNLGSNQDLSSLTITTGDANSQTLDLKSPSTAGAFNQVQVFASNLAAAKASLYTAIVNANAAGAPDPLDGITDSGLHASSKIGLAQQADHITIRSTRIGDLNLDGSVTISDFIDLASNFGTVGTATWQEGDLNYDRNVSISDFIDLASNFGTSYAGSAGAVSAADIQTVASFASSIGVDPSVVGSAVPEPGTLSLLAIGAMGLMGRRRRSRKA